MIQLPFEVWNVLEAFSKERNWPLFKDYYHNKLLIVSLGDMQDNGVIEHISLVIHISEFFFIFLWNVAQDLADRDCLMFFYVI